MRTSSCPLKHSGGQGEPSLTTASGMGIPHLVHQAVVLQPQLFFQVGDVLLGTLQRFCQPSDALAVRLALFCRFLCTRNHPLRNKPVSRGPDTRHQVEGSQARLALMLSRWAASLLASSLNSIANEDFAWPSSLRSFLLDIDWHLRIGLCCAPLESLRNLGESGGRCCLLRQCC